ncbi:NAD-dependent epimerase/dehydratase family protein [Streptomyces sp. WMMC500]|uniref:NAD-dependent epimerase/dehydratase family protein n=1 Tax=Streptomyces sp. WMMC500 TaxID=3015154 RepID=UPI00248C2E71|nr:NAD-dependent epimerase/dehydratase family protein [Streptomyces sp. WMMC500]WBB61988.1 NAD-dependent epimerase/dehydratase family protein [Streptomyces sp. WMMC500]
MNVVVTGGAGFIGANLCRWLTAGRTDHHVTALDDLSTGSTANLDGVAAEFVEGSVLDARLLDDVISSADAVVHLAARPSVPRSLTDPVASHEANATGTVRVLEACRRRGVHVIAASSSSVYGDSAELPKHEALPTIPLSPYAASKVATEAYTLAYGAAYRLPVLVLRFFNVYGPLQSPAHAYAAVVPAFIDAMLRGRPVTIFGDGLQTRDFTYVGTVVRVLADAVEHSVCCRGPVNLAFGNHVSLRQLVERLTAVVGSPPREIRHEAARAGDVRDSQAADGLLRRLFPDVTPEPLDTGLAETVRWFRRLPGYVPDPRTSDAGYGVAGAGAAAAPDGPPDQEPAGPPPEA